MYNSNIENTGSSEATFLNIIRMRAKYQPEKIAFTFIMGNNDEKINLSYYELDKNIRRIASLLQGKKIKGERAILLFENEQDLIENFAGCLYAGVIAVPVYPPDTSKLVTSLQRIKGIIDDSQAKIILASSRVMEIILSASKDSAYIKKHTGGILQKEEVLKKLALNLLDTALWVHTEVQTPGIETLWVDPGIKTGDPAYIQYTSGSTGAPKGVVISHENILVNSRMKADAFEVTSEWGCVSWLPLYHDMGLVGGVFQSLYSGFTSTLMPASTFLTHPLRWLKSISEIRDKPVVSGGPNFAYELCCRRIPASEISNLNLSNWEVAFSGAEPVRESTIEKFYNAFKTTGFRKEAFYPCYGLAEATLFVSGGRKNDLPVTIKLSKTALQDNKVILAYGKEESLQFVGCGYARGDGVIRIVDPETKELCRIDQIGEVWFSSRSAALGYWNKKEESGRSFNAYINGNPEQPFLRTGDLGFIKKDQLFITGRLKDLIIIRGKNHYPQDIEFTTENCHPLIRQNSSAAFSVDADEEEKLIIAAAVNSGSDGDWKNIVNKIREAISIEHDLNVYKILLIKPKTVFKTTSGKIQRSAVKSAYINNSMDIIYEFTAGKNRTDDLRIDKDLSEGKAGYNEIVEWLKYRLASLIKTEPAKIDIHKTFSGYGIDSLMAVELAYELERKTGRKISSTIVWEYSSIDRLAKNLSGQADGAAERIFSVYNENNDIAAIVGMSCRFPGADNPDEFWNLLVKGIDAVTEVPSGRWNVNDFYDENPDVPGKISSRWGGFIKDIDKFDPEFFGLSPRESVKMDPQQRILLEVVWEALENSGIIPVKLAGSKTGVFIGISNHDYSQYQYGNYDNIDVYGGTGNSFAIAANRISYILDLHGPSMPVDTACSSSLVALHLACRSLLSGESDNAIVGGVNLIISPEVSIAFTRGRMLSPDGRCKTFDADADGYVRSEGCGVVVLKRLSDALRDGNNILAVIKGTAVNQDGRSNGLTAPNKVTQIQVIRDALDNAKVSVNDVGYIEAHGTGTALGDPVEAEAINEVFKNRSEKSPVLIGSVKTNIGHLESAAGIAGLIKTVLMLQNKWIPANLHFKKLNPYIKVDLSKIRIADLQQQWDRNDGKRIAGISSFGFGGVNAHIVLEEYQKKKAEIIEQGYPLHLLTLSAKDENSLMKTAEHFKNFLVKTGISAADVCRTASTCRTHFEQRMVITGRDNIDFADKINLFLQREKVEGINTGHISDKNVYKTVMLFTGQGAQYINMGKRLYDIDPFFRKILNECNNILNRFLDKPLLDVLFSDNPEELNNTYYTQPALFVIEYAAAKLWMSWGIQPDYLIGHSIGEYSAACIAEVFTLEEALMLVSTRARLMQSLPLNGGMAVIFADKETAAESLKGFENRISIAGINGPLNTVISGNKESIVYIVEQMKKRGIHTQYVNVSHAFHSPLMNPILEDFGRSAEKVEYKSPKIPIVSNLTGKLIDKGSVLSAGYWKDQIRDPVLFTEGMKTLAGLKAGIFIETGPNPVLIALGKNCLPDQKISWLPSLKNGSDDWDVILDSLAKLYTKGADIDWNRFYQNFKGGLVYLPNYPFKKERYWIKISDTKAAVKADGYTNNEKNKIGPMVHSRIISPIIKEYVYESKFNLKEYNILSDHRIFDKPVMPAAGYIEMILEALNNIYPAGEFCIENFKVHTPSVIYEEAGSSFQLILEQSGNERKAFKIFSSDDIENRIADQGWKLNVSGEILLSRNIRSNMEKFDFDDNNFVPESNKETVEFYNGIITTGIKHGNTFTILKQIWAVNNETLGHAVIDEHAMSPGYIVHPALLDAGFQLFSAVFNENQGILKYNEVILPVGFDSFQVFSNKIVSVLWIKVSLRNQIDNKPNDYICDVTWYDDDGNVYAEMAGLKFRCTEFEVLSRLLNIDIRNWIYEIYWKKQEVLKVESTVKNQWLIIEEQKGIGERLAEYFSGKGELCRLVQTGKSYGKLNDFSYEIDFSNTEDYLKLFNDITNGSENSPGSIVYICSSNGNSTDILLPDEVEYYQESFYKNILEIIRRLVITGRSSSPRLWFVTSNSRYVMDSDNLKNINQFSLGGFVSTAANELPEINFTLVDFDELNDENTLGCLISELESWNDEENVAYRNNERYVPRLIKKELVFPGQEFKNNAVRLEIREKGSINNLEFVKIKRENPGEDEVEIEVKASGLNFRDVMNVLGLYPGDAGLPGNECSGIIAAVGKSVKNFKPGDEVIGIAHGCFGNYAVTKEDMVIHKPLNINFTEGAAVPIACLTAHYALNKLAKISKNDRILIHSATGGVGLAAISIARMAGAEIYATAGAGFKHEYLNSLGVKYIMNSRSQNYVSEVMSYTNGRGVSIILNSLSGDYIPNGLSILSPGGCFLEIGKAGIWNKEKVLSFRDDISYYTIAIDDLSINSPGFIQSMMVEIKFLLENNLLMPIKYSVFPLEKFKDAFRLMMKAEHIGKIVISNNGTQKYFAKNSLRIDSNSGYLITGGLGELGLKTAEWLSSRKAGQIILLGRSDPSAFINRRIERIRISGTLVTVIKADVSNELEFKTAMDNMHLGREPLYSLNYPIKGIIHAAGMIDDGIIFKQVPEKFEKVLKPKINGAINIHNYFKSMRLDFIIYYSSVSSILGTPGQSNYAAANSFLDTFAHYQRNKGINSISINWSAWSNTGMARNISKQNSFTGKFAAIIPNLGFIMLDKILEENLTRICIMDINQKCLSNGQINVPRILSDLADPAEYYNAQHSNQSSSAGSSKKYLTTENKNNIIEIIQENIRKILGLDKNTHIETIKPLQEMGLDSLMAIELKNEIKNLFGKDIPMTVIFNNPTIASISDYLTEH